MPNNLQDIPKIVWENFEIIVIEGIQDLKLNE